MLTFSRELVLNVAAELFVVGGGPLNWRRVTDVCIVAHPDDVEIGCHYACVECLDDPQRGLLAVVVTDGGGLTRTNEEQSWLREEIVDKRWEEQVRAGHVGEYAGGIGLMYHSDEVKSDNAAILEPIKAQIADILRNCPQLVAVHTHSLLDTHPTHEAVARLAIGAIRSLPDSRRPQRLYGSQVWDGIEDAPRRLVRKFDVSDWRHLIANLVSCFKIESKGKNYPDAVIGRLQANATFGESHNLDCAKLLALALDMSELIDSDVGLREWARSMRREHLGEIEGG